MGALAPRLATWKVVWKCYFGYPVLWFDVAVGPGFIDIEGTVVFYKVRESDNF